MFRALVAGDVPSLDTGKLTTGTLGVARGGTGAATLTGLVKGAGTSAFSAATSGTDYAPGTSALATGIVKSTTSTGALSIAVAGDFPTLNQNTIGTAAGLSATLAIASGGTGATSATGALAALSAAPLSVSINAQTGTTYTLALTDAGYLVTLSNAGAIALSIPVDAIVAFPVGTQILLMQLGAGQVTVAAVTPGTTSVNGKNGLKTAGQYAVIALLKVAANSWVVTGDTTT